ncbi:MAG: hypothetical protein LH615_08995 [Ferruginibacter sp.]|nr:hypothetical protein [Ferruginibacter sp.]
MGDLFTTKAHGYEEYNLCLHAFVARLVWTKQNIIKVEKRYADEPSPDCSGKPGMSERRRSETKGGLATKSRIQMLNKNFMLPLR